jgi:hypothetical protein
MTLAIETVEAHAAVCQGRNLDVPSGVREYGLNLFDLSPVKRPASTQLRLKDVSPQFIAFAKSMWTLSSAQVGVTMDILPSAALVDMLTDRLRFVRDVVTSPLARVGYDAACSSNMLESRTSSRNASMAVSYKEVKSKDNGDNDVEDMSSEEQEEEQEEGRGLCANNSPV